LPVLMLMKKANRAWQKEIFMLEKIKEKEKIFQ
jgi:hypothetical protein